MTGAKIERGRVTSVSVDGVTIRSVDRDGIETPPLTDIGSTVYAVGDWVYFFIFPDGTGKILCKLD